MRHAISAVVVAVVVAGCAGQAGSPEPARVSALPPRPADPADNPGTPAKAELGKQLFFDKRLSGDGSASCETCHLRTLGWTDGKDFSPRVGGAANTRHTPSLYNVGYQKFFYWDGRAPTLEANVLAAWRVQMNADPAVIAPRLDAVPAYKAAFQAAFGAGPSQDTIVKALATYLRTLNSGRSPWDRYEAGQRSAVSADAVEGHKLFTGKALCVACHIPPLYTDGLFHNVGLEHGKARPDPGRANVTKEPKDSGSFKTPTLRSIAASAPYFHDASARTLEEAVRYMASGGKPDPNKDALLRPLSLTDQEIPSSSPSCRP